MQFSPIISFKKHFPSQSSAIYILLALLLLFLSFPSQALAAFRFISWADTKSDTNVLSQLSDQAVTFNPQFTIYPGDLVSSYSNSGMDTWIKAVNGELSGTTTSNNLFQITFPVRGNHDGSRTAEPRDAILWQQYFDAKDPMASKVQRIGGSNYSFMPKPNLSCTGSLNNLHNLSYSFDFQNSHIVGLDVLGSAYRLVGLDSACPITQNQLQWLDQDLAAAENRGLTHAFIYFHGPVYCVDGHCTCSQGICDRNGVIAQFLSVANKHPIVTATFHGHEHLYTYTYLDSKRESLLTHPFHQFVTGDAGAGPDTANSGRYDYWMNAGGQKGGFITVDVNGPQVTVNWYKTGSNTSQHSLSFSKTGGTPQPTPTGPAPTPSPTITPTTPPTQGPTPTPGGKPGDANGDGKVDLLDYVVWLGNLFKSVTGGAAAGDFNSNGAVDGLDFIVWLTNFTGILPTPTPTSTQPTPTPTKPPSVTNTPTPPPAGTPTPTLPPGSANFKPFGTVSISSSETAFNVNGAGTNIDTIAFWEAPNPSESLMFVTSKNSQLVEAWKYPFKSSSDQLTPITACLDAPSNGVWVDQETDLLYVSMRNTGTVCVFNLPALTQKMVINTSASSGEPNLGMLKLPNGQKRLYVSSDSRVYIHDASTGQFIAEFPTIALETVHGDNLNQVVYIPDEKGRSGVHVYDPDGKKLSSFGGGGIFNSDEEGIWMYTCPLSGIGDNGDGLIIVSDQIASLTDFEFFNRRTKEYLGKVNISGVSNTDGISITQQASTDYPKGIFAVLNNDSSVVGVKWETIFQKTGLNCGS